MLFLLGSIYIHVLLPLSPSCEQWTHAYGLPVWSVCSSVFLAGHGVFREVCFVRLLSAVLSEADSPSIDSLRSHPSLPLLTL